MQSQTQGCSLGPAQWDAKPDYLGFAAMEKARKKLGLAEIIFQDDNAPPHTKAWGTLKLGKFAAKFRYY